MPVDSPDFTAALHLIVSGVPVFVARAARDEAGFWEPEGGHHKSGYWLPKGWQNTAPSITVLERYRPGDALCAVMGHTVDLLDVDPRAGGEDSFQRLQRIGINPRSYGTAATPSGGTHYFIASVQQRSLDGLMPGLDVKAGLPTGEGRGFAFIAPTVKRSKTTGKNVAYVWSSPVDLDQLVLVGGDDTGRGLAELMAQRTARTQYDGPAYEGPSYEELSAGEQELADNYVESIAKDWAARLEEAIDWPEGQQDTKFRGWEGMCRDAAYTLARLAITPWTRWTEDTAEAAYLSILPPAMADDPKCRGKWTERLLEQAASKPVEKPWWDGLLLPDEDPSVDAAPDYPDFPRDTDDAYLAEWVGYKGLKGEWRYMGGLGWHRWDGKRWKRSTEEDMRESVRKCVLKVNHMALRKVTSKAGMVPYLNLRSNGRIGAIAQLMKGTLKVQQDKLDKHEYLLNVSNGVVDLRTGDIGPHDKELFLTKVTPTRYEPDASDKRWDKVQQALDADVLEYMQVRYGQAITGIPTSDDKLVIGQGGGSNGKTTFLNALKAALGEYLVPVPAKLLLGNPNDHSTDRMVLYGCRVAVLDETPEAGQLNTQQLKNVLGQDMMTARYIRQDNVEWKSTHSLFVMTNFIPVVSETDHGSWRRLMLVRFKKTFTVDEGFRVAVANPSDSFKEAVLAWLIAGSVDWYKNGQQMPDAPPSVLTDTDHWRLDNDLVMKYALERLDFTDPDAMVEQGDLFEDLKEWLRANNQALWSVRTMNSRFTNHELFKPATRIQVKGKALERIVRKGDVLEPLKHRPQVWRGIKWREED